MTWLHRAEWAAMDVYQKSLERGFDEDYKTFLWKRYDDARKDAFNSWKKEDEHLPNSEKRFFSKQIGYDGPYFIVYGRSPTHTELYPSCYEKHLDRINRKLQKYYNIWGFIRKVSFKEPIPIVDIMKEIKYPKFDLTEGRDYTCYVRLGIYPHKNH